MTSAHRRLWGYLTAVAISLTGTRITTIAVPWLVLTTTGSATKTGIVAFAEMAPLVILQALCGPHIDRIGARRLAIGCQMASAIAIGLVPVLHHLGTLSFPALVAIVAAAGGLRGPGDAAVHAMVPGVVSATKLPMERVTGLSGAVERTASMAGAAAAGAVVALLGPANALLLDAFSFLACALILVVATRGVSDPVHDTTEPESYLQQLRSGWRFMRTDPLLIGMGVMLAITNCVDQAYSTVLLPVWAHDTGRGVAIIGILGTIWGACAAGGSVIASVWAARLPRFQVYLIAFILCGAPRYLALAVHSPIIAIVTVYVIGGIASGFLNPILGAVLFERIPAPLVGRVSSLNLAMSWSLMPLGGPLAGIAVAAAGLSPALLIFAAAYFAATMLPALQPRWREMSAPAA